MTGNIEKGIEEMQKNNSMPHLGYGVREGATGHISSGSGHFQIVRREIDCYGGHGCVCV